MKYLKTTLLCIILLRSIAPGFAQFNTRLKPYRLDNLQFTKPTLLKSKSFQRAIAVPLLFTIAGLYSLTDNDIINKYEVQEERNEWIPTYHNHTDDYLQYAPMVAVYGLNALGVKGKNNFGNRTALLIKSELIVGVLTYSLKRITAVPRPDTLVSQHHSRQAIQLKPLLLPRSWRKSMVIKVSGTALGRIRWQLELALCA